MEKKKILFIISSFTIGGAEKFLVSLINRIDKNKYEPLVLSLSKHGQLEKEIEKDINVLRIVRKTKYDYSPIKKISELLQGNDINKVFIVGSFPLVYFSIARRIVNYNGRLIVSFHGTKPRSIKDFVYHLIYFRLLKDKDKVIGVCSKQIDYISNKYYLSKKRMDFIYNGVDTNYFSLPPENWDAAAFKAKYGIEDNARLIVQVAAFRKEKKHEDSIKALQYLHNKYNIKAYIFFVGGGDDDIKEKIALTCKKMNLDKYIYMCGPQEDVRPFLWSADIFTLSSISIETFSIATLEALSSGLACVITDLGGASEMIENGKSGYIIKPNRPKELAEAWKKVLTDATMMKRNEIRNRIISKFSIHIHINKYDKLLEE